jgi:hypothetical protein
MTDETKTITAAERRREINKKYYQKTKTTKKSEMVDLLNGRIEELMDENQKLQDTINLLESNIRKNQNRKRKFNYEA